MSWTYKVEREEEKKLPDGTYMAEIESVQRITGKYGSFIQIKWNILDEFYEGQSHLENFNIESDNQMVRSIAKKSLNRLCCQVPSIPLGQDIDISDMERSLQKVRAFIAIRTTEKNDKIYVNVIGHEVMTTADLNPKAEDQSQSFSYPLNDEVPF